MPTVAPVDKREAQPPTPSACLKHLVQRDGSRPLVTFLDEQQRVELSGTTLQNWVAKLANLLTDELGLSAGDPIGLALPRHWLAAAWLLAVDATGGEVRLLQAGQPWPDEGADLAALVVGPDDVERAAASSVSPVLACSLSSMGQPFTDPLPPSVHDVGIVALTSADFFAGPPPDPDADYLSEGTVTLSRTAAMAQARAFAQHQGWTDGERILALGPLDLDAVVASLLAPMTVRGSAVWIGNHQPASLVRWTAQERVSAVVG